MGFPLEPVDLGPCPGANAEPFPRRAGIYPRSIQRYSRGQGRRRGSRPAQKSIFDGPGRPSITPHEADRQTAFAGPFQGRIQVGGIGDMFAVAPQTDGGEVVAGGIELTRDEAVGAVLAELNLVFGIPPRIVTDDGDEIGAVAVRRLELGRSEIRRRRPP